MKISLPELVLKPVVGGKRLFVAASITTAAVLLPAGSKQKFNIVVVLLPSKNLKSTASLCAKNVIKPLQKNFFCVDMASTCRTFTLINDNLRLSTILQ